MKLMFVYKILPAFVIFTDNLDEWKGGQANGPIIRLRTKYEGTDEGILQHELTHVKQWYRTLFTHPFLYLLAERYRVASEVEAYKKQASCYDYDALPWMACTIVTKYNVKNTSEEEILRMLKK